MGILRKKIRQLQKHLFFMMKRDKFTVDVNAIYTKDGFKNREKTVYFNYAKTLEELFQPKSIVDIGCANGYMLEYFYKKGSRELLGFEGAQAAFEFMAPEVNALVHEFDLRQDIATIQDPAVHRTYDLVNCTEVGEHIPVAYEDVFLNNILRFVGRILVLSWSHEWEEYKGLSGTEHVNPRSKAYVIRKVEKYGLVYDDALTQKFVATLALHKEVFKHWTLNMMVFRKK